MIKLDHVSKSYGNDVLALDDVSVEIAKGEFVFVVGQSGSGKSTFLRLLTKEERPTAGKIWVAGKELNRLAPWKVPAMLRPPTSWRNATHMPPLDRSTPWLGYGTGVC